MTSEDMPTKSLYRQAFHEVVKFRLRNAGSFEDPSREWNRRHWWDWARRCWVEHLRGTVFWIELGESDFGLMQKDISSDRDLVERVLEKLEEGHENLDIINWAMSMGSDVEEVVSILEKLDMNRRRDEMRNVGP